MRLGHVAVKVFPGGNESIENFKINFQDLERVMKLAKIRVKHWKSMEIPNRKEIGSIWAEFHWRQSSTLFVQCAKLSIMIKNFKKWREVMASNFFNLVLKKFRKKKFNVWEPCIQWYAIFGRPGSTSICCSRKCVKSNFADCFCSWQRLLQVALMFCVCFAI